MTTHRRVPVACLAAMIALGALVLAASAACAAAAKTIVARDVAYKRDGHQEVRYEATDAGVRMTLQGLEHFPLRCNQPDSLAPIAVPCGPNAYAQSVALFAVLADTDLGITVLSTDREVVASAKFVDVAAGPYAVWFSGNCLLAGSYWVQVKHEGRVVGELLCGPQAEH